MRVRVQVEPVNQAFVAAIDLPALELDLALRSDWTDARPVDHRWVLDGLQPDTEVTATVVGRELSVTGDGEGRAVLAWDGLDAAGTPTGPAVATATVDGTTRRMRLGRWDARSVGLGGLLVAGYDHLDVVARRVHLGTGRAKRGIAIHRTEGGWRVPRASGRRWADFDGDGFCTRVTDRATGRALLAATRDEDGLRSMTWSRGELAVEHAAGGRALQWADRRLQLELDDDGRVRTVRGPAGGELGVGWEDGLLTSVTDPDGFTHAFTYDDLGRLATFTRPGRGPTRLVRTATDHGRRVLVLTAEGRESSYQVEVLPDGTKVRTTRCCGRPPRVTRIDDGHIDVEVGDGTRIHTDRVTGTRRVVLPSGLTRERTVAATGLTVNGRTWQWTSDGSGTSSTSPEGRVKGIHVADGEATMFRPGAQVTLRRDDGGRVVEVVRDGRAWQLDHDAAGLVVGATADDGTQVAIDRDAAGWLLGQDLPGGRTVRVDRGRNGDVRGITAPGGGTTRTTTTAPDQVASWHFPVGDVGDGDVVRVERDRDGLVVGFQHGTTTPVTLRRGATGLLEEVLVGDTTLAAHAYEYGRPVRAATAEGQVTSMVWDGPLLASVAQEGIVTGTVHRAHDADLQVAEVRCGELRAEVRRDRDGLVTGLGPAVLDRDEAGRLVAVRAGVVTQTWEHDEHGRVAATQVDVHGRTGWRVDYGRDARGRIVHLADSRFPDGVPAALRYDEAGRLVEASGPFPFAARWDANGNATSWRRGEGDHEATHRADDRLSTVDGAPVEHDGAGRVQRLTGTRQQLRHDPRGRLVGVTAPGEEGALRTRLTRDAHGHVVLLERDGAAPLHLLPGPHGHPVAVVTADGAARMLLVGGTRDEPPLVAVEADRALLLVVDHLGTIRLVVDVDTGELVDERLHDHWGRLVRRTGASDVPFGWGGGLLDTTSGLVHFPHRSYSPELLRFVSRDPLLFRGRSTNLYAYADGDPVNHGDPTGRTKICRSSWYRWGVPGTDIGETWEHWWLVDENGNEAGWGPEDGSDYNDTSAPGEFGEVRDHGNRSEGAECDEVEDVDDECVAREMAKRMGDELGFWGPGNTCQTWVDDVLSACSDGEYTVATDSPESYENIYGPNPPTRAPDADAGYTPADGQYTPADGGSLWD